MWKQIEGHNYEVSEDGQVRNIKTGLIRKQNNNGTGYLYVALKEKGIQTNKLIHRLIAEAYIPNPENKRCIDHIDRCRTNNNISNLRWVTHSENIHNSTIVINAKNISFHKRGGYVVQVMRQSKQYRKYFKKLEDAEAYLEELKSTIIINGVE
jgi:glycyl-tRNA synthetase beta subunit